MTVWHKFGSLFFVSNLYFLPKNFQDLSFCKFHHDVSKNVCKFSPTSNVSLDTPSYAFSSKLQLDKCQFQIYTTRRLTCPPNFSPPCPPFCFIFIDFLGSTFYLLNLLLSYASILIYNPAIELIVIILFNF